MYCRIPTIEANNNEPGDDEKSIVRYINRHVDFVEKLKCVHEGLAELTVCFFIDALKASEAI